MRDCIIWALCGQYIPLFPTRPPKVIRDDTGSIQGYMALLWAYRFGLFLPLVNRE